MRAVIIVEEELPNRAGLEILRTTDPDYGLADDEIRARNEFIRWYLTQDYLPVLTIPAQTHDSDFFLFDATVRSDEYSAFNTHDFQRSMRPFNKYAYAMKMIMERVKDLAILHSVVSCPEDRAEVRERYEAFVNMKFREYLMALVERYNRTTRPDQKFSLKQKIGELNRRIIEAKRIWEQYAPWGI